MVVFFTDSGLAGNQLLRRVRPFGHAAIALAVYIGAASLASVASSPTLVQKTHEDLPSPAVPVIAVPRYAG